MTSRKIAQYSLLLFVCGLFFITALYKTSCLLSLYPNDWFLNENQYKNNPNFIQEKTFSHFFICDKAYRADFLPYARDFEPILKHAKYSLRNHKHRTVFLLELNGRKYVLKRYNIKHFFNWLQKATIRSSQAFRSWHYGQELLKIGVATPKPLVFYEKKWGPFWISSYILTEYLEGTQGLDELAALQDENYEKSVLTLLEQLERLESNHFIHADYGYRNILVVSGKPYLIDLDDLHQYRANNLFFRKRFYLKHNAKLLYDLKMFEK